MESGSVGGKIENRKEKGDPREFGVLKRGVWRTSLKRLDNCKYFEMNIRWDKNQGKSWLYFNIRV